MTTIATNTSTRGGFAENLSTGVVNLIKTIQKYRLYVITRNELMALSSRDLNDLGLHRSQIKSVAYDSVYGY